MAVGLLGFAVLVFLIRVWGPFSQRIIVPSVWIALSSIGITAMLFFYICNSAAASSVSSWFRVAWDIYIY